MFIYNIHCDIIFVGDKNWCVCQIFLYKCNQKSNRQNSIIYLKHINYTITWYVTNQIYFNQKQSYLMKLYCNNKCDFFSFYVKKTGVISQKKINMYIMIIHLHNGTIQFSIKIKFVWSDNIATPNKQKMSCCE